MASWQRHHFCKWRVGFHLASQVLSELWAKQKLPTLWLRFLPILDKRCQQLPKKIFFERLNWDNFSFVFPNNTMARWMILRTLCTFTLALGSLSRLLSINSAHMHAIGPHTFNNTDWTFINSASSLLGKVAFTRGPTRAEIVYKISKSVGFCPWFLISIHSVVI